MNERGLTTKLEHLSALFHGWMIETGFESITVQHGQAGGMIEMIYYMHNIPVIVQLLPIGGDIVRVKALLTIPNDSTILESFRLIDSVRASSIVGATSGDDRFNPRAVAEVKIRFKDEVALPAKHRQRMPRGVSQRRRACGPGAQEVGHRRRTAGLAACAPLCVWVDVVDLAKIDYTPTSNLDGNQTVK